MKAIITLITFLAILTCGFSQDNRPSAIDGPEIVNNSRVSFPDRNVSEAAKVLDGIAGAIRARNNRIVQDNELTYTDEDYYNLIRYADDFFINRKFSDAAIIYKKASTIRNEQEIKDKALESEALVAKEKKIHDEWVKDETIRAKAVAAKKNSYNREMVQMTGGLLVDKMELIGISKIGNKNDEFSNFLKIGRYETLSSAIPIAIRQTLDGIAIPAGVRVIFYSEPNYTGEILLDQSGPAVINNFIWKFDTRYNALNDKDFTPELQSLYPQAVRHWSDTNMHLWSSGSMIIVSEN